ncbi:hypothetical protein NDU88_007168 [Pleurodeles waltl]|uniref:Uncharacterized protein n=1 Tax=Pleurodeles waltl TaxID=8319 RepID=A0AAV7VSS9_PLEWA|nr:hypothetical protein NDU88_007168 [Pleurodeles waltl]
MALDRAGQIPALTQNLAAGAAQATGPRKPKGQQAHNSAAGGCPPARSRQLLHSKPVRAAPPLPHPHAAQAHFTRRSLPQIW